jgi:lysophospholipase L1-like esterase
MISTGQTILFIGDSITDCGRRSTEQPLGNGYVKLFRDLMIVRRSDCSVQILNKGIGGDQVTQLRDRWTDDVLRHNPDWLSIKVGINDLIVHLCDTQNSISPQVYEEVYDGILTRTRDALPHCQLLLIDPFFLSNEPESDTLWRGRVLRALPDYLAAVERLSARYNARHVRTHALFQSLLKHHDMETFAPEPVHPHLTGHLAIAEAVYAALES